MLAQNQNECFNGQILGCCPKTEFTSRSNIETSLAMAAVEFNKGPQNSAKILKFLGVADGCHFDMAATKAQSKRLRKAEHAASPAVQQHCKMAKLDKTAKLRASRKRDHCARLAPSIPEVLYKHNL